MATATSPRSTRNARSYKAPSEKARGLNLPTRSGHTIVALFGLKDKTAKAIASVVLQKETNVMFLNINSKTSGVKPFSARLDRLVRPAGMTPTRLAFVASRTGRAILKK